MTFAGCQILECVHAGTATDRMWSGDWPLEGCGIRQRRIEGTRERIRLTALEQSQNRSQIRILLTGSSSSSTEASEPLFQTRMKSRPCCQIYRGP